MTDKPPPQWALDKADIVLGHLECSLSDYTRRTATAKIARLLVEERERCAQICDEESNRGISMSLCAEQMAMKIREYGRL